jgi:hypothetical protein
MIIYTVRYKGIATIMNVLFVNVDLHILNCQNNCILPVCVLVFAQI